MVQMLGQKKKKKKMNKTFTYPCFEKKWNYNHIEFSLQNMVFFKETLISLCHLADELLMLWAPITILPQSSLHCIGVLKCETHYSLARFWH